MGYKWDFEERKVANINDIIVYVIKTGFVEKGIQQFKKENPNYEYSVSYYAKRIRVTSVYKEWRVSQNIKRNINKFRKKNGLEERKNKSNHRKIEINENDYDLIMKKAIQLNSATKAIKELRDKKLINTGVSDSFHKRILVKREDYKDWIKGRKLKSDQLKDKIKELSFNGSSILEIQKELGLSQSFVWDTLNRNRKLRKKRMLVKAKELVNNWNKYSTINSIMSQQTIQAFEYLNLTPPERL